MSSWWNYAVNQRAIREAEDRRYAERRQRERGRAERVTADVKALNTELMGYTDMEFITFARALTAEVMRLRKRVEILESGNEQA